MCEKQGSRVIERTKRTRHENARAKKMQMCRVHASFVSDCTSPLLSWQVSRTFGPKERLVVIGCLFCM